MNYTQEELAGLGFKSVGKNVKLHKSAIMINTAKMSIGDDTRIDAFCMISAGEKGLVIGNNVHIATGVYIFGGGGLVSLANFSGISSRSTVYTATDDYVEGYLTNPTVPEKFRKVATGDVILETHALIGASSVVMPGVTMKYGSACGSMTFVNRDLQEFELGVGHPMRVPKKRGDLLRKLEAEFLQEKGQ
jgi:galactoside O-acetyltransferase